MQKDKDLEIEILKMLNSIKKGVDEQVDWFVKVWDGKVILAFRSKLETPVVIGDWVAITVPPQDFSKITQLYQDALKAFTKKQEG